MKNIEGQHESTVGAIKKRHGDTVKKIQEQHKASVTNCKTVSDAVENIAGNHDTAVKKIVKDCVKEKAGAAKAGTGGTGAADAATGSAESATGATGSF